MGADIVSDSSVDLINYKIKNKTWLDYEHNKIKTTNEQCPNKCYGRKKKKRYHFSTLQHVQPVNSLINNKS
jgi:hypothetical protein